MSPSTLLPEPSFSLTPMEKSLKEKTNFGAVVEGLNLEDISDADVKALSDAIWTHKVVVVKGQQHIHPRKQWELVTRFDPDAPHVHSHGDIKTFTTKGGLLSKNRDTYAVPGVENVRIIGKGYQGENHYGLENCTVQKAPAHEWHAVPLPQEEYERGHTRFQRWHIDAPLFIRDPAWFTTLRCIKRPTSPAVTVHWDDGTGQTMTVEPGLTAFFSNVQTYDLMTEEERRIADNSWVEYAPFPYQWIGDCQGSPNGLGISSVGKERNIEELGTYDEKNIKRYPMVWVNPVTGERAFMVHGICARRLFMRSSPEAEPTVIDDVVQIRKWLKPIQERVLKPEYIMVPSLEEGDIVMWANYQMFHTAIDYPDHMGPRTMHQANIGASSGPVGLFPIPAAA
ncbi:Clavaminate synthase-like protein [Pleurostoma richardsiae]|uniref:Clavaminate synthase-like protein n=1 Tax=Pleurostoma richardsiae TaxID=41990 RepID=A0AA38VYC7_9PEZI|nr:Clavaminate synthase-like protein [Pleurostoma richardsiae]